MGQLFIRNQDTVVMPVGNGAEVFLSNNRPVAGYTPELGWFKTDAPKRGHINKHIAKYLAGIEKHTVVAQEFIDGLLREQK